MHFGKMPCEYAGFPLVELLNIHLEPLLDGKMPILTYLLASGETKLGVIV